MRTIRLWLALAGLNGALAVALAAYAAHGLAGEGAYAADLVDKATRYQGLHALALLAIAALQAAGLRSRFLGAAAILFVLGIALFCGALYGIALAGLPIGWITPFGGGAFILGWLSLGLSSLRVGREMKR